MRYEVRTFEVGPPSLDKDERLQETLERILAKLDREFHGELHTVATSETAHGFTRVMIVWRT